MKLTGKQKMEQEERMPDWEVAMKVLIPNGNKAGRPRRMSIHTIAAVCGRQDIIALADEMSQAKYPTDSTVTDAYGKKLAGTYKVAGYRCPDVNCLIFYLMEHVGRPTMIHSAYFNKDGICSVWEEVFDFCTREAPYPEIKGFKRFPEGSWSGGRYGVGTFIPPKYGMEFPFEPEDYPYARAVIKALKEAGYEPGITIPDHDPEVPIKGCTMGCPC